MCEVDADCNITSQVCYKDLSWTTSAICDCSHFYGGTGVNCAELSVQSYVNLIIAALVLIIVIVALFLAVAFDVRRAGFEHRVMKYDNTTLTWGYCVAACITTLIWACFVIQSALQPELNNVIPDTQVNAEKLSQYGVPERLMLAFAVFFGLTASLNVSLMWIDVASKTKKFKSAGGSFDRYRLAVRIVQAIWLVVIVAQGVLGVTFLVIGVGVLLAFGISITYWIGRTRFVSILEESMSRSGSKSDGAGDSQSPQEKKMLKILNMIKTTSSGVIISLILVFLCAAVSLPLAFNWQEYGRPGEISAYPTLLNAIVLILLGAILTELNYCHRMLENSIESKKGYSDRTGDGEGVTMMSRTNIRSGSNRNVEESL